MRSTVKMDMKTTRRTNFQRIVESRKLGPAELARDLGKRSSYWSDLLRDENKSFGEKIAREIEEKLGLDHLTLDQPVARGKLAHPLTPRTATMALQTIEWRVMMTKEPEELPDEFRVDLEDDAMAPDACAGWSVELSKVLVPVFGDDVLVRLNNKEYHYRRYRQNPRGGWIAAAIDADFASFESLADPKMRIVAVMAFVRRPRRAAA